MRRLLAVLLLAGCSGGEANHLGNPLLWPAYGLGSAVGNAVYDARRKRVAAYIAANRAPLKAGQVDGLARIARIPATRKPRLRSEITALPPGPAWVERATVIAIDLPPEISRILI